MMNLSRGQSAMDVTSPTPSPEYSTSDDEDASRESYGVSGIRIFDNDSSMTGNSNGQMSEINFAALQSTIAATQAQLSSSLPSTSEGETVNSDLLHMNTNSQNSTGRKRTFSISESQPAGDRRTATKICRVCGDKAYSYNFNVITCESCKAFFRRNANKEKEIRCPFNDQCDINIVSRRFCQRCRLQKCFRVGMKKEWIMSEEARLEKKQRILDNRERRAAERHTDDKVNKGTADELTAAITGQSLVNTNSTLVSQNQTNPSVAQVAALLPTGVPFSNSVVPPLLAAANAPQTAAPEVAQLAAAVAQVAAVHGAPNIANTTFPTIPTQNNAGQMETERALIASIAANASVPGPPPQGNPGFVTNQQQIVNLAAAQIQQVQLEQQLQQQATVQQIAAVQAVQAAQVQAAAQIVQQQQHQLQQQQLVAAVAAAAASTMVSTGPQPQTGGVVSVPTMAATTTGVQGQNLQVQMPSSTDMVAIPRDVLIKLVEQKIESEQAQPVPGGTVPVKCQCHCNCGRYPSDLLIVDKVMTDLLENSTKYNNSKPLSQLSPKREELSPPSHILSGTPPQNPLIHTAIRQVTQPIMFQPMCTGVGQIPSTTMPLQIEDDYMFKTLYQEFSEMDDREPLALSPERPKDKFAFHSCALCHVGSSSSHQFGDNQAHRSKTLGNRSGQSMGPWQKTVPALLKSSGDLGASFIDYQRRNRMNYGSGRARSEVGDILNNGNSRLNTSFNYSERSFNDDMRVGTHRSSSVYERPKSSHLLTAPPPAQRVMRPRDDWMEVRRQPQFSSEDDFDEEEGLSEDEELAMYNTQRNFDRGHTDFDESDIFVFGVIQLSLNRARQIVRTNPPPPQFWNLKAEEKTAYLYYYTLYKHYITPVKKFYNVFNREFFRYTAEGCSETEALVKICRHTKDEYDARRQRANKIAYDRSRRHLFSDDRATPDSRASDRPSYSEPLDESDLGSIDSSVKEPLKFSRPHAFVSFGPGGKLLILDPEYSICSLKFENVKSRIKDKAIGRNIAELEAFKGPYIVGETPSHLPLLYIERQIGKILNSEIYRQNPESSDANDVLLIWRLLEILVRQHGHITGPDLARLLTTNYSYSSTKPVRGRADKDISGGNRTDSPYYSFKDERKVDPRSMEKFTQYLIGGYIEEAIESAMSDGLLFDALILAYKMFGNNPKKLEEIELKLLSFRSPQQPALTLLSVASQMPVPILNNMSSVDDASGWRAHIAIVLANLNTPSAMKTVHELGLALSRREFNAAADFCFLAVNLLTNFDCFSSSIQGSREGEDQFRTHITLINASLPDDRYYSTQTPYGWSITDFQATEIYEYSIQLSQRQINGGLKNSNEYQRCKLQYAQLLAEYGGFGAAVFKYCAAVAGSIWDRPYEVGPTALKELCDLGDSHYWYADLTRNDVQWINTLKNMVIQLNLNSANNVQLNESGVSHHENSLADGQMIIPPPGTSGFETSTPVTKEDGLQQSGLILNQQMMETNQQNQSFVPVQQNYNIQHQQQSLENFHIPQIDNQQYSLNRQTSTSPTNSIISNATLPMVHDEHNYGISSGAFSPKRSIDFGIPERRERVDSMSQGYAPSLDGGGGRLSRQRTISQNSINTPLGSPKSSFAPVNHFDFNPIPEQSMVNHNTQKKNQDQKGGLLSGLAGRLVKMIPTSNQMILPDDTNPTIRWDPNLNRYVGDGVEEVSAAPPPPPGPVASSAPAPQPGITGVAKPGPRRPGGSRYANPFGNSTTTTGSSQPPDGLGGMMPPIAAAAPPLPPSFGFMPVQAQDDEGFNPFSDNPSGVDGSQQTVYAGDEEINRNQTEKTILLIGPSGARKDKLIDFICNVVYGVNFENDYRFRIANTRFDSTTPQKTITKYVFYGSRFSYRPVVIDTPDIGDSSGIQVSSELSTLLTNFLYYDTASEIHAVCLVLPSNSDSLPSHTLMELQRTLSLFPPRMKENIIVLITFSENQNDQSYFALRQLGYSTFRKYFVYLSHLFSDASTVPLERKREWEHSFQNLSLFLLLVGRLDPKKMENSTVRKPPIGPRSRPGSSAIPRTLTIPQTIPEVKEDSLCSTPITNVSAELQPLKKTERNLSLSTLPVISLKNRPLSFNESDDLQNFKPNLLKETYSSTSKLNVSQPNTRRIIYGSQPLGPEVIPVEELLPTNNEKENYVQIKRYLYDPTTRTYQMYYVRERSPNISSGSHSTSSNPIPRVISPVLGPSKDEIRKEMTRIIRASAEALEKIQTTDDSGSNSGVFTKGESARSTASEWKYTPSPQGTRGKTIGSIFVESGTKPLNMTPNQNYSNPNGKYGNTTFGTEPMTLNSLGYFEPKPPPKPARAVDPEFLEFPETGEDQVKFIRTQQQRRTKRTLSNNQRKMVKSHPATRPAGNYEADFDSDIESGAALGNYGSRVKKREQPMNPLAFSQPPPYDSHPKPRPPVRRPLRNSALPPQRRRRQRDVSVKRESKKWDSRAKSPRSVKLYSSLINIPDHENALPPKSPRSTFVEHVSAQSLPLYYILQVVPPVQEEINNSPPRPPARNPQPYYPYRRPNSALADPFSYSSQGLNSHRINPLRQHNKEQIPAISVHLRNPFVAPPEQDNVRPTHRTFSEPNGHQGPHTLDILSTSLYDPNSPYYSNRDIGFNNNSIEKNKPYFSDTDEFEEEDMSKTTPNWRNNFAQVRERFGAKERTPVPEDALPYAHDFSFASDGSLTMPRGNFWLETVKNRASSPSPQRVPYKMTAAERLEQLHEPVDGQKNGDQLNINLYNNGVQQSLNQSQGANVTFRRVGADSVAQRKMHFAQEERSNNNGTPSGSKPFPSERFISERKSANGNGNSMDSNTFISLDHAVADLRQNTEKLIDSRGCAKFPTDEFTTSQPIKRLSIFTGMRISPPRNVNLNSFNQHSPSPDSLSGESNASLANLPHPRPKHNIREQLINAGVGNTYLGPYMGRRSVTPNFPAPSSGSVASRISAFEKRPGTPTLQLAVGNFNNVPEPPRSPLSPRTTVFRTKPIIHVDMGNDGEERPGAVSPEYDNKRMATVSTSAAFHFSNKVNSLYFSG
ncbi:hypothetical protein FO519_006056 [Halicephalobus sp. NKZ332]|nr:hypothetical protein FO519_006056 [Halicephalobus sp. NKZ332]